MTTFHNEYLELSVPALAKIRKKFLLVIYNDNPDTRISRRKIRKMGYHGALRVINGNTHLGQLRARLAILGYLKSRKIKADWFIFVDDDDALLNLDIPHVAPHNFAVIQNMAVIRTRLIDVLRLMKCADNLNIDNKNIELMRPHVGTAGTLVRMGAIMRLYDILTCVNQELCDIDESLSFRPPVDTMMWTALNIIARHDNEFAAPIYMDTLNYIATDIDTAPIKYGMKVMPEKNASQQIARAIAKYDALVRSLLTATNTAAPAGQD